jgi:hypothetical protein
MKLEQALTPARNEIAYEILRCDEDFGHLGECIILQSTLGGEAQRKPVISILSGFWTIRRLVMDFVSTVKRSAYSTDRRPMYLSLWCGSRPFPI